MTRAVVRAASGVILPRPPSPRAFTVTTSGVKSTSRAALGASTTDGNAHSSSGYVVRGYSRTAPRVSREIW